MKGITLARPSSSSAPAPRDSHPQTKVPAVAFVPKPTDQRAELFWLLGTLQGRVDSASRIFELVVDLIPTPVAPAED